MEEVKDTLWKWAIGLVATLAMGATCFVFFFAAVYWWQERNSEFQDKGVMLSQLFVILTPFLTVLWFKLLFRKLWASWATALMLSTYAYFCLEGTNKYSYDADEKAMTLLATCVSLLMLYALIFKPKLWRGGF